MEPRSGKPCIYPQSSSTAVVFLVNPINRGAFGRLPGTFLPSNSVMTTSAEVEVEKKEGKKICLSFQEVPHLKFWSLLQVQLSEIVWLVCKKWKLSIVNVLPSLNNFMNRRSLGIWDILALWINSRMLLGWSSTVLPGSYSEAELSGSGWHWQRCLSSTDSDGTGQFLWKAPIYLRLFEMRCQITVTAVVGMYRCTTQSPNFTWTLQKYKSESIPFRTVSEVDSSKLCVHLCPTFSRPCRKLFMKCFPWGRRGQELRGGRCCLVCHVAAQLLRPASGVWSDTGQPSPAPGS